MVRMTPTITNPVHCIPDVYLGLFFGFRINQMISTLKQSQY